MRRSTYAHNKAVLLNYKLILDFVTHRIGGKEPGTHRYSFTNEWWCDTVHMNSSKLNERRKDGEFFDRKRRRNVEENRRRKGKMREGVCAIIFLFLLSEKHRQ